ncbi:MAG: DUF309 domain-containing protein [Actinomycetota bacterium]
MTGVSVYVEEWARLVAAGDYFLAHETLEEHWVDAPEQDRPMLQGLIHLAVGLLHHSKGNAKGASLQFAKAGRRLEGYPDAHLGVDVAAAREFLAQAAGIAADEPVVPPALLTRSASL